MRSLIIGMILFLSACNQGSNGLTQADVDVAVTKAITPLQQALAAATHSQVLQAQRIDSLQLIGKVHGTASEERIRAIGNAAIVTPSFGPCVDMGVMIGFANTGNNVGEGALSASYQAFKTCTGYLYEAAVGTGNIKTADRIFWDGPNCTGNLLEWEAGGAGYNTQALQNGVVFINPVDGTTQLMVSAKQTPKPILIQSVWVIQNPGCQSDIETQLMYQVTPNDVSITGVPNSTVGNFSLSPP